MILLINKTQAVISGCLLILLVACSSAPEHLYTLEATSAMEIPAISPDLPNVILGPVSLPELIDRPQIVLRNGEYSIDINEQKRWASPLKESLPRVIAAELARLLPGQNFIAASANVVPKVNARLIIEFSSFDLTAQQASIIAHWAFVPADKSLKTIAGLSQVKSVAKSADYLDTVDAARHATLNLAEDIAKQLARQLH